jgi:type VI secretion system protein ImpG
VEGIPCQFATSYPVTLFPLEVVSATLEDPKKPVRNAQQALVIRLKAHNGLTFAELGCGRLRFFLNGQRQHVFHLYELLFNNVCSIECEAVGGAGVPPVLSLDTGCVRPVGFEPDEGMLPYSARTFPGYLLLFEYFCFPEKFLFFDFLGLERLHGTGSGDTIDIRFYLDRPAKSTLLLSESTFCLNAAPVVNLFRRIAEPIRVEHQKTEYLVIPDIRRAEATEVFTVDSVAASRATTAETLADYKPLYSIRHHREQEEESDAGAFWHMQRRPSERKGDTGTSLYLSFSDLLFRSTEPEAETLTVHVTCTNRDLPARLPFGDPGGDFEMELAAPVSRISCRIKPTPTRRPSLGGALQWRFISHLSLNYLSLVEGGEDSLREILKLYDFEDSPVTRQQIDGIVGVQTRHVTRRIGQSFCRGIETSVTFDEEKYVGSGVYLFASVLERFLGQYVSVNSFSRMIALTVQRKERLKEWPPRNGNRILL